uniref:Uncharacterized protein n=1 Tax=Rhizophora mucronata TaxID=61149 RepID=A0A2P2JCA9_RHIMU
MMLPGEKRNCIFLLPFIKVSASMLIEINVEVFNINWICPKTNNNNNNEKASLILGYLVITFFSSLQC